jgi:hypothetical protein
MKESEGRRIDLEKRLARWRVSVPADPSLRQQVLRRIDMLESQDAGRGFFGRFFFWASNNQLPAALCACTAAILICAVSIFMINRAERRAELLSRDYFMMIDPVAHVASDHSEAIGENPSVVDMLSWMKSRFNLSREQFAELVALHEDYSDHLMTLYRELSEVQDSYQTFENKRLSNETIDFMALYDLLQKRDSLRKDSVATSRQLVDMTLRVLTPAQKQEYLSLMERSDPDEKTPKATPETHAGA